jgi:succinate dehydrogenase hydrophobic anchor subunit
MKDWAVSFIAAVLLVGLVIWCAYVVIPLFR